MFNPDDFPFGPGNSMRHMQRQMMQDMDMMMGGMMRGPMMASPFGGMGMGFPNMSPFGGFGLLNGGNMFQPAISDGSGQRPTARRHELEMDPFGGFGGLLGAMANGRMPAGGGGNVFMSTQVMTIGPDGKPSVQHQTVHKTGDVTETKRRVEKDGTASMTIGHQIGDRSHFIEKKRDKDGNVRKQQRFVNLDEESAEDFDREFSTRIRSNYGFQPRNRTNTALEFDSTGTRPSSTSRSVPISTSSRNRNAAPIITLPDEEEPASSNSSSNRVGGPVIREIGEEEAEQSIPKRRRDMFGGYRAE